LFWGDAIGGPLKEVFGDAIVDVPVWTHAPDVADFFTHTTYWDLGRPDGCDALHIAALRKAIDLEDASMS
jgi:hypothetical protein